MSYDHDSGEVPVRFLPSGQVIGELIEFGRDRIGGLGAAKVLLLGVMGGAFIAAGALFSVLLASGFESRGAQLLVEGLGFSAGFFFVVLSEAALFTEANVVMPATLLAGVAPARRVARFWGIALLGNLVGGVVFGWLVAHAQPFDPAVERFLGEIIDQKMSLPGAGGLSGWTRVLLSGVLANWLVGLAAFFATMGRTIIGRYIPILLAVTLFVAAGFQHAPANMGYFSLAAAVGSGPDLVAALNWNLIPAGIGNVIGGTLLVALPFWILHGRDERVAMT